MDPRYPIGKFNWSGSSTAEERSRFIDEIAAVPQLMRSAAAGLNSSQLDTPYRTGGWTVRQVVHHVPDSHMNSYVRFKLALTEDAPTIKPHDEARWAELPDTKATPIEVSLTLLDSLDDRWMRLLQSLDGDAWKRTFRHPDIGPMTLEKSLALYAWHGRHHVAHITELRKQKSW